MIVAEQVAAALDGGLVSNAVNIPVIGADDLEVLGPYVPLASRLGRIAMELAGRRGRGDRDHGLRRASPTTTRACSLSRRSTAPSRAAPTVR